MSLSSFLPADVSHAVRLFAWLGSLIMIVVFFVAVLRADGNGIRIAILSLLFGFVVLFAFLAAGAGQKLSGRDPLSLDAASIVCFCSISYGYWKFKRRRRAQ